MKVLMITSEWPTPEMPQAVPFIKREVEFLQKEGVDVEVFAFRGNGNPFKYLWAWFQMRRKLVLNSYDLIHAQWGQSAILALPKRLPLVITFRGSDLQGYVDHRGRYTWSGHVLQLISKVVALFADEIIIVSKHLAAYLPVKRFNINPGGIPLDVFRPMDKQAARQQLNLNPDHKLVLFAASPQNPIKRYELAKAAVSQLLVSIDVELIVAQNVSHDMMPIYMNACDVLILTSTHEGSPTVVREALACNLPIVSVDVGDIRERIGSLPGCFLCEDVQLSTIASALQKALNYDGDFEGRSTILEMDEMLVAQEIIKVYKKATKLSSNS